jgi:hypothetical protein
MTTRPKFLDVPGRHTRTARTGQSDVDRACAVQRPAGSGYGGWFGWALTVIAVVSAVIIVWQS